MPDLVLSRVSKFLLVIRLAASEFIRFIGAGRSLLLSFTAMLLWFLAILTFIASLYENDVINKETILEQCIAISRSAQWSTACTLWSGSAIIMAANYLPRVYSEFE